MSAELTPIQGAPLRYAPVNEQGVVAIFAAIARSHFGMTIELIQTGYPDCVVVERGRELNVEFEFKSRNFTPHLQVDPQAKRCDVIVCWEHNWPAVPDHLRVIALRDHFGLGKKVWVQPYKPDMADGMAKKRIREWSAPASASVGDLVLIYRSKPEHRLSSVLRITRSPYEAAHWEKPGRKSVYADLERVVDLPTPIPFASLKADPALQVAPFVLNSVAGRQEVSAWWPLIRELAVRLDPANDRALSEAPGDFCFGGVAV